MSDCDVSKMECIGDHEEEYWESEAEFKISWLDPELAPMDGSMFMGILKDGLIFKMRAVKHTNPDRMLINYIQDDSLVPCSTKLAGWLPIPKPYSLKEMEITLNTSQIIELCKFSGIAIDYKNSTFHDSPEQLESEYVIAQNEFGTTSWIQEYPEEGVYPLSGGDWQLWLCDQETGKQGIIKTGSGPFVRDQMTRYFKNDRDVWIIKPDGSKELPSV